MGNYGISDIEDIDELEIESERYSRMLTRGRFVQEASTFRRLLREASRRAHMFSQDEVWVNSEGRYVPIKEMSARYAENVMHFLEGNALSDAEMIWMWDTRDDANAGEFVMDEDRARDWVRSTPLYRALREASERPF